MKSFTNALALLGASACATNTDSLTAVMEKLGQTAAPSVEYPGDKCCFLYKDVGYGGEREKVCHDGERRGFGIAQEFGQDWNNKMSSYYCGKNVWYNMCDGAKENCYADQINSGAGHHKNPQAKTFNDKMGWMEMGPYDPSDVGAVTFFTSNDCSGRASRAYWTPPTSDNISIGGQYTNEVLWKLGTHSNEVTSMLLPKGYRLDLYDDNDFIELVTSFEGKYKNNFSQEMECINFVGEDYNNKLNSVIITRSSNAVGSWQAITSTETQEYKFHVGINTEQSSSTAEEIMDQLTFAAELGFEFMAVSGSISVEKSMSETLYSDMQQTYGVDYGIENTTTCTAEGKEGAGMYQWVINTRDAKSKTFTWHTVCRTGADFNIPPACPYGACLDAQCRECAAWAK